MSLQDVIDAKAAGRQVLYQGAPVTIVKASAQLIYVTTSAGGGPVKVTADQLSPL